MDSIETSAIHKYKLFPCFWGRLIDDVVCIWKHALESLDLYHKRLNSFDKNVKFIVEFEEKDKIPFLDILLIRRDFYLLFSVYRKPIHSDRYLILHSCHPISVKPGVVVALVDRIAFGIRSLEFLDSELMYLRYILFCNSYPVKFIDKIIRNRRIKHDNRVIGVSQCTELNLPKSLISLSYVPILEEILKRIFRKHNIHTCFQSVRSLGSSLNSGKDLTGEDLVSGV